MSDPNSHKSVQNLEENKSEWERDLMNPLDKNSKDLISFKHGNSVDRVSFTRYIN